MVRTGSLTLTTFSSLVLMRISDLVPLCKFTKLLWEHLMFMSWRSFCGPSCDQWWYILQRWQVTTSHPLSLQEPFKQNLLWNGQKNISFFNVNKDLPHCHHCAEYFCLSFAFLYEAEHCCQGGMAGSASETYKPQTASTASSSIKAEITHTRASRSCSTKFRGLLKVTQ